MKVESSLDFSSPAQTVCSRGRILFSQLCITLEPFSFLLFCWLAFWAPGPRAQAGQAEITGPPKSGQFGTSITVLPNGNFVVTDPAYGVGHLGAVYLYDGSTLGLMGSLIGQNANDQVGGGGIIVLSNGNFLVKSTNWNNGSGALTWISGVSGLNGEVSAVNSLVGISTNYSPYSVTILSNGNYVVSCAYWNKNAGAVTWGSGTTGVSGVVSAANSLVGNTSGDQVGFVVTALNNGNYVVSSPNWNNGLGAATWVNGATGITGVVSPANSLVGSASGDQVGDFVTSLSNGNYVVSSSAWQNGSAASAGAATWCNGSTGRIGAVSAANSLVGTTANDQVGLGITLLANGNYVLLSPNWQNGSAANAGAATWGSATLGVAGTISATNSLVGTHANDNVGGGVVALNNGNYVVSSGFWNNGAVLAAGAATWGNGLTGTTGVVSAANSLVGGKANDQVGYGGFEGVTALSNGNYVVCSRYWDNGSAADAGAVTWASGTGGVIGLISSANSLVGTTANDQVGGVGVVLLSSGNYVVPSASWDNGAAVNVGAVTFGSGTAGVKGVISSANSLIGTTANDFVGSSVTALNNGNYVVNSANWHNGSVANAGAATWCSGATGRAGAVTTANSLVGSTANDYLGSYGGSGSGVCALSNGNYVVGSPNWHNGSAANTGAATWCGGTTGKVGAVTAANSLIGTAADDYAGSLVTALSNGNYVVQSQNWRNGTATSAGAVTWANGATGRTGAISATNSLVGSTSGDNIGGTEIILLNNGNFAVTSPFWDNGTIIDAGAVTWCDGSLGTTGLVVAANSFLGTTTSGGFSFLVTNDPLYNRVLIGRPSDNRVSLLGFTPHLIVQQPTNNTLANGSTRIFGAPVGSNISLSFTIRNTNLGDLTGLGVTIDGTDAALFSVTPDPSGFLPGPLGATNFVVRFAPASTGNKTAALHIASSDAAQNPFNVNLSGKGLSYSEDTDGDGMSDAAEFALAALGFDWQSSQSNLVNTYYAQANSAGLYTSNQVQALSVDFPLLAKDPQTGEFTLTIGVQKSTNLFDFSAFPMSAPQTTINAQGELQFRFNAPDNAAFFRLETH
jgi:hypothetical protein